MTSEEHQKLASFIKHVHQTLRYESQKCGAEEAWKTHCNQTDLLNKYAVAMKQLATKYWDINAADETSKASSRIEWIAGRCIEYFFEGGMICERDKEEKKSKLEQSSVEPRNVEVSKMQGSIVIDKVNYCRSLTDATVDRLTTRLHLLDVGSCYNPFKIFPFFKVLPVDIAPASSDVYCCDFLNVDLVEAEHLHKPEVDKITELPENSFDLVVFSLLLEYMPCSEQRLHCCLKAYDLLKAEGLLFIVTPDSKNPSANAPLMKSWRIALAYLGFTKVFYEKLPHIHCMAYRKALCPDIAKRLWIFETKTKSSRIPDPRMLITIPQDSHNYSLDSISPAGHSVAKRSDEQDEQVKNMFLALPDV